MSDANPPPTNTRGDRYWRFAKRAVWSPVAAWGVAVLLVVCASDIPWWADLIVGSVLAIGASVGLVVCVYGSLVVMFRVEELCKDEMPEPERARLWLLGFVGFATSLVGYGFLAARGVEWALHPLKGWTLPPG